METTTRKAKELNLFIGKEKHSGNYVFLDEAFEYENSFKGLTGSKFTFLTEEELSDRLDNYNFHELRVKTVKANNTCDGLDDWVDGLDKQEKILCVLDNSYSGEDWLHEVIKYANKTEDQNYEYTNCVGGGRCFNKEMLDRDFREYVNEENYKTFLDLYKEYEGE